MEYSQSRSLHQWLLLLTILLGFSFSLLSANESSKDSCVTCHSKIEDIRHQNSEMMQQIATLGQTLGDSKGCVICHGGNPNEAGKELAHKGAPMGHPGSLSEFVRDPGSIWISDKTCGVCHPNHTPNLSKALMQTEAGKIQGNLWAWGTQKTTKVSLGNYDIKDEDGVVPNWGTHDYKRYMVDLISEHPNQFPTELKQVPLAPMAASDIDGKSIDEIGEMASITYQRSECQRCHVGVRGRKDRGDYRGMGCSSCHIPYSNEGFYEGKDTNIKTDEPGHLLVHMIQGSENSKVKVHDSEFSGIHPETCNSCHNRGKRIGVSYVGLMENDYMTPFNTGGKPQAQTHGKRYMHIKDDLHFEAGMTCQDCHTSIDMHGDGNIFGTTLAQVEIECSDCHGTVEKYPWELQLGYGEEFGRKLPPKPRGIAESLPEWMHQSKVYDKEGGYLLSTRGNPLGNVIKNQAKNEVVTHLASGKVLKTPLLKELSRTNTWKSPDAKVAMESVAGHMDSMECYSCHADWAPQCYGCHVNVDYSGNKKATDWIATGNTHLNYKNGETLESVMEKGKSKNGTKQLFGSVSESRSYLRWEDPILGINGEGRVTPLIPGCQVTFTVIGPKGETLILNKQAQVPDGPNGSLVAGTDMSPVQPHTTGRQARTCESCHNNPKTLGYGSGDGQYNKTQGNDFYMDIQNLNDGKVVSKKAQVQLKGTPGMDYNWDQIVTRDDKQLQTVGSHWETDGPLPKEMRDKMEKTGACIGCHQNMVTPALWNKLNTEKKVSAQEHAKKMDQIFKKAAGTK